MKPRRRRCEKLFGQKGHPIDNKTEASFRRFRFVLFAALATPRLGKHHGASDKIEYLGQFRQSRNSQEIFSSL
jgi:hypothetical protein